MDVTAVARANYGTRTSCTSVELQNTGTAQNCASLALVGPPRICPSSSARPPAVKMPFGAEGRRGQGDERLSVSLSLTFEKVENAALLIERRRWKESGALPTGERGVYVLKAGARARPSVCPSGGRSGALHPCRQCRGTVPSHCGGGGGRFHQPLHRIQFTN